MFTYVHKKLDHTQIIITIGRMIFYFQCTSLNKALLFVMHTDIDHEKWIL